MLEKREKKETQVTALVRVLCFLERMDQDRKPTPEYCEGMDFYVEDRTARAMMFLLAMDGDDGEQFAETLGWPSAAALRQYIHGGLLPNEKTH